MSYRDLPAEVRSQAETELTRKQLDVLKLSLAGAGIRRISLMLEISPSTARDHLHRAKTKIAAILERQAA